MTVVSTKSCVDEIIKVIEKSALSARNKHLLKHAFWLGGVVIVWIGAIVITLIGELPSIGIALPFSRFFQLLSLAILAIISFVGQFYPDKLLREYYNALKVEFHYPKEAKKLIAERQLDPTCFEYFNQNDDMKKSLYNFAECVCGKK